MAREALALSIAEYEQELQAAGFEQISIGPTHTEADQMYGSIVRATRRSLASSGRRSIDGRTRP